MRILQTPARFYPYIGGVEKYCYDLSRTLVDFGHDVSIICANEPVSDISQLGGVEIKRLAYFGKIANTNITPSLFYHLMREDPDIIHTHLPHPWSADWSLLSSVAKRKPLVLTYHNDIIGRGVADYIARLYNASLLKMLLGLTDAIIITQPNYLTYSPYLKKYREKVNVVPIGVDNTRFGPQELEREENTIFFLSVLDEFHWYKGLDILLRAMVRIKKTIPDVKLIVGGNGILLEYYRKMAESLGLGDNVEFLGFIADEDLVACYNTYELFVLPSISRKQEGFGIVLLEAMACRTPVVTTDIVGVADEVNNTGSGIVVKPGDINGLADAILKVLENKDLGMEMGSRGRRLIEEKYTWIKSTRMIEEIYSKLLEKK